MDISEGIQTDEDLFVSFFKPLQQFSEQEDACRVGRTTCGSELIPVVLGQTHSGLVVTKPTQGLKAN